MFLWIMIKFSKSVQNYFLKKISNVLSNYVELLVLGWIPQKKKKNVRGRLIRTKLSTYLIILTYEKNISFDNEVHMIMMDNDDAF